MVLVFPYKDMLEKAVVAKNSAIHSFSLFCFLFFVTERNQLNTVYAQLLEKLRPIAFAETSPFLTIQSLEYQEMWQKIG